MQGCVYIFYNKVVRRNRSLKSNVRGVGGVPQTAPASYNLQHASYGGRHA